MRSHKKHNLKLNTQFTILTWISLVRAYVTNVVSEEKNGAKNTQTLRMSTVKFNSHNILYKAADVTMRPG